MFRVRMAGPPTCFLSFGRNEYFVMQGLNQMIEYFFPALINRFQLVNTDEPADICIYGVHLEDLSVIRDNEINIFICIENMTNPDFPWYKHNNKWGEYGDPKARIYIYSHITKIVQTPNYTAIPAIHYRLNYYKMKSPEYKQHPELQTPFRNKLFCLMINKSALNKKIPEYVNRLKTIGRVDNIGMYDSVIRHKSCYNSIELLRVFNKYKFILCFENSYNDGYITEKKFNCLFANTVPIYSGSRKIANYINDKTFVDVNNPNWYQLVSELNKNKSLYNSYLNSPNISPIYDNENFQDVFLNALERFAGYVYPFKLPVFEYGVDNKYINVTKQVLENFLFLDGDTHKIVVKNANYNTYFGDPVILRVKTLRISDNQSITNYGENSNFTMQLNPK